MVEPFSVDNMSAPDRADREVLLGTFSVSLTDEICQFAHENGITVLQAMTMFSNMLTSGRY